MVKRIGILALFAMLTVAALASSLGTAFKTMPLNPDMVEMALIYQGIVHHGWRFPFTWHFTQDNQILSLLPFAEVYYALAGVSGSTIIVQGWLIFVVNAALTGLLVKEASGSWKWGYISCLMALLASPEAIGQPAILAYPVTHNSVWAFGLLGTYGLIRYLAQTGHEPGYSRWALPLVLSCVFIGTVSDPWFDAAFTVPAVLLTWRSARWFRTGTDKRRALLKGLIITYIAGRLTYFGLELLHMVPGRSFNLASPDAMVHHLILLIKSTALLLQLYPLPAYPAAWMVWILYAGSLSTVLVMGVVGARRLSPSTRILAAFAGFSIAAIAAAFVLTGFAQSMISSRFLDNVFYFVVALFVAVGAAMWSTNNNLEKSFVIMTLIGYIILGTAAVSHAGWRYTADWEDTKAFGMFLEKHDLHAGYGPYFGANAPLLGIATHGVVIAHPVSVKMGFISPGYERTFWLYRDQQTRSDATDPQFVIIPAGNIAWRAAVVRSLGPAKTVMRFRGYEVFIYNHSLLSSMRQSRGLANAAWKQMNIARNRAAINRICNIIGISPAWAQQTYSWMMTITE